MVSSSSSSFALPSSSEKKTTKFPRIQKTTLFKKPNSSSSSMSLIKRRKTIFKKAEELEILCDIEVCVICYEPGGDLHTWPADIKKVKSLAERYYQLSETKRRKASVNLDEFLEKITSKDDGSKKKKMKKKLNLGSSNSKLFPDWDPTIYGYSEEKLTELYQYMEQHCTRIQQRFRTVFEAQEEQRNKNNMAYDQAMNHQNSVHPFNYENNNCILSQIPVSASSAFNQGLPMYPNLNEFQNPNMSFNFDYNNVEDYLSFLGIQVPEINTNVCMTYNGYNDNSNNNTNGLSHHQLLQYPTQTPTNPGFQFGSFNTNF